MLLEIDVVLELGNEFGFVPLFYILPLLWQLLVFMQVL